MSQDSIDHIRSTLLHMFRPQTMTQQDIDDWNASFSRHNADPAFNANWEEAVLQHKAEYPLFNVEALRKFEDTARQSFLKSQAEITPVVEQQTEEPQTPDTPQQPQGEFINTEQATPTPPPAPKPTPYKASKPAPYTVPAATTGTLTPTPPQPETHQTPIADQELAHELEIDPDNETIAKLQKDVKVLDTLKEYMADRIEIKKLLLNNEQKINKTIQDLLI